MKFCGYGIQKRLCGVFIDVIIFRNFLWFLYSQSWSEVLLVVLKVVIFSFGEVFNNIIFRFCLGFVELEFFSGVQEFLFEDVFLVMRLFVLVSRNGFIRIQLQKREVIVVFLSRKGLYRVFIKLLYGGVVFGLIFSFNFWYSQNGFRRFYRYC